MATSDNRLGKYEIVGSLGSGGMGTVYKARHPDLKRTVAIKLLLNSEDAPRFVREAQLVAKLKHPNIVQVFDTGMEGDRPYIVMEFVEGRPFRRGDDALAIGEKVARTLHAAHEAGIVHRDVKPSNILIDARGEPHVLDFGLAKAMDDTRITTTGEMLGTPSYMSPEQANGRPADTRTDIYSLGATMYEILTGRPPFRGESLLALLKKIDAEPAPPAGVSPAIDAVLAKALAKRPEDRYRTMAEFADALRAPKAPPSRKIPIVVGLLLLLAFPLTWGLWKKKPIEFGRFGDPVLDEALRTGDASKLGAWRTGATSKELLAISYALEGVEPKEIPPSVAAIVFHLLQRYDEAAKHATGSYAEYLRLCAAVRVVGPLPPDSAAADRFGALVRAFHRANEGNWDQTEVELRSIPDVVVAPDPIRRLAGAKTRVDVVRWGLNIQRHYWNNERIDRSCDQLMALNPPDEVKIEVHRTRMYRFSGTDAMLGHLEEALKLGWDGAEEDEQLVRWRDDDRFKRLIARYK